MFADDLGWSVSLKTLGSCIPRGHMPCRVKHKDRVILDGCYQQLECFILIRAFPELKLSLMFFGDVEEFHLDAAQYPVAQNWDCS